MIIVSSGTQGEHILQLLEQAFYQNLLFYVVKRQHQYIVAPVKALSEFFIDVTHSK